MVHSFVKDSVGRKNMHKILLYKKDARKMLVKLTPGLPTYKTHMQQYEATKLSNLF